MKVDDPFYSQQLVKRNKTELERIERLEYNEKVKEIILMIFAMIIFISIGIVIIVN